MASRIVDLPLWGAEYTEYPVAEQLGEIDFLSFDVAVQTPKAEEDRLH